MQSLWVPSGGVGANHNIHRHQEICAVVKFGANHNFQWHPEIFRHGQIQLMHIKFSLFKFLCIVKV